MHTGNVPLAEVGGGIGIGFLGHVIGNYDYSAAAGRFYTALANGKFELPYCDVCETMLHPRRELCPGCLSADLSSRAASGKGVVYSFSVMEMTPFTQLSDEVPYVVGIVELDDGVFLFGRIEAPTQAVRVGLRVCVDVAGSAEGARFVVNVGGRA